MRALPRPVHVLTSRRHFLAAAAAGLGALAAGGLCRGDDRPPVSADVERAVNEGLKFLDKQQRAEKAFEGESGVTVAARTLLAFLAAGNVPDVGRHGLAVRRAVDWLLDQQGKTGWYGPADRGLRPHLSAATALSQAYGVESNAERRTAVYASLGKAAGVILGRQAPEKAPTEPGGGWAAGQSEGRGMSLAVTALSVFALRACAGIGVAIPQPATARAVDFTLRCFDAPAGGFGAAPGLRAELRSTCAGVVSLFASDATAPNAERLGAAGKFIVAHAAEATAASEVPPGIVPLAALKLGGEVWSAVGRPLTARLVSAQQKDGSWPPSKPPGRPEISRIAATAWALSVLTMSYPLLPIYQR